MDLLKKLHLHYKLRKMANTDRTNRGSALIILLLLVVAAVLGWFYLKSDKQVEDLTAEKAELQSKLNEMIAQYDAVETDNDSLRLVIQTEKERLLAFKDSISNVRNGDLNRLNRYKSELAQLKKENTRLVARLDSVSNYASRLAEEKEQVELTLQQEMLRTEDLTTQKSQLEKEVKKGSILQATSMSAYAIKRKRSGDEDDTRRASRADEIKACVNIAKNLIAQQGERALYVRVITPDNRVVSLADSSSANTFSFNGKSLLFSGKKSFWYENEAQEICVYVTKQEDFIKGSYKVEAYTEGYKLGEAYFELK